MMTDLILAITHHLLAFSMIGFLFAEHTIVRPGLAGVALSRLRMFDRFYGLCAGLVIVVGVLRVIYGLKEPDFYLGNLAFWAKMAAFVVVGLFSIQPTVRILAWGRRATADPDFVVPDAEIRRVRIWLGLELVVFALIPIFAAMMARGIGL
jgi:putative membrane protein